MEQMRKTTKIQYFYALFRRKRRIFCIRKGTDFNNITLPDREGERKIAARHDAVQCGWREKDKEGNVGAGRIGRAKQGKTGN